MAPLDRALVSSHTDMSPWTCPREWIDADINHITSTIQVFAASMQSAETENVNFGGDMIYQVCLIVTIFKLVVSTPNAAPSHLHICTPDVLHARQKVTIVYFLHASSNNIGRLLSSFKETLAQWQNWDFMTKFINQQLIKDHLLDHFRYDLHVRPTLYTMQRHL